VTLNNRKKYEHQVRLITSLRALAGPVAPGFLNQMEFFITNVRDMAEHLMGLKREMLEEGARRFLAGVERGSVSGGSVLEFKSLLDKLVSGRDFAAVTAALAGSAQFLKNRVSALQPLSIEDEEGKAAADRDKAADALVSTAYKRMKFDALEKDLAGGVNACALDRVLLKARESMADYCCLYQVPLREDDTLTPFSVSRIESVAGSCFRLLRKIRELRAKSHQPG